MVAAVNVCQVRAGRQVQVRSSSEGSCERRSQQAEMGMDWRCWLALAGTSWSRASSLQDYRRGAIMQEWPHVGASVTLKDNRAGRLSSKAAVRVYER